MAASAFSAAPACALHAPNSSGSQSVRSAPRLGTFAKPLALRQCVLRSVQPFRSSVSLSRRRAAISVQAELKEGDRLQDYPDYYRVLKKSDGGGVALSSFEGKKPIVLFFYPKAGTPGCTKQACSFRDAYGKFTDAGWEVFGISSDPPEANAAFAKEQRLPFPLLTDQSDFLRKSFGIKADLLGALKGRKTYVIDKEGVVRLAFQDQFGAEKHVGEALKLLEKLK